MMVTVQSYNITVIRDAFELIPLMARTYGPVHFSVAKSNPVHIEMDKATGMLGGWHFENDYRHEYLIPSTK
jgi:hypothetical protein